MREETGGGAVMKIIVDPLLVKDGDPYPVKRTWKERLFTRPFRPLQRTRMITPKVPDTSVYVIDGVMVMHPETKRIFDREIIKHRMQLYGVPVSSPSILDRMPMS
jgi:hypothetical protein